MMDRLHLFFCRVAGVHISTRRQQPLRHGHGPVVTIAATVPHRPVQTGHAVRVRPGRPRCISAEHVFDSRRHAKGAGHVEIEFPATSQQQVNDRCAFVKTTEHTAGAAHGGSTSLVARVDQRKILIEHLADMVHQPCPCGNGDVECGASVGEHTSNLGLLRAMPDVARGHSLYRLVPGRAGPGLTDGEFRRLIEKFSYDLGIAGIQRGAERLDQLDDAFEASPTGDPMFPGDGQLCVCQDRTGVAPSLLLDTSDAIRVTCPGGAQQILGLLSDTAQDWDVAAEGWSRATFLSKIARRPHR